MADDASAGRLDSIEGSTSFGPTQETQRLGDFAFPPKTEGQVDAHPYAHLRINNVLDKQKADFQLALLEVEQVENVSLGLTPNLSLRVRF